MATCSIWAPVAGCWQQPREVVDRVVATDINPVAADAATQNLAGMNADVRTGDLFAPVADMHFDLVILTAVQGESLPPPEPALPRPAQALRR